jgi:nicotinic acid mononucleotide adenylyltransferase
MPRRGLSETAGRAESVDRWRARYDAAWARLNDSGYLVELERLVATVDPQVLTPACALTCALIGGSPLKGSRRVGLLAGSFNPLTLAHLAMAQAGSEAAELDALVWTMAAVTVDKERVERATLADRLAQLAALAEAFPGTRVALANRGLYVDQVRALRAHLARDAEVTVMVGFDKIVQIFDPHYYRDRDAALRELFGEAHLAVAPRGDAGEAELEALLRKPENRPYAGKVTMIPLAPQYRKDSSTEARRVAGERGPRARALRSLLPPEGCALAATGAYTQSTGQIADGYHWRQVWLRAQARAGNGAPADLPPLDTLIRRTRRQTKAGERIRQLLIRSDDAEARAALWETVRGRFAGAFDAFSEPGEIGR